jgi:hypothetical protein
MLAQDGCDIRIQLDNLMNSSTPSFDLDRTVTARTEAVNTARRVMKATGCTFPVAVACVEASVGDYGRACKAVRGLRQEVR